MSAARKSRLAQSMRAKAAQMAEEPENTTDVVDEAPAPEPLKVVKDIDAPTEPVAEEPEPVEKPKAAKKTTPKRAVAAEPIPEPEVEEPAAAAEPEPVGEPVLEDTVPLDVSSLRDEGVTPEPEAVEVETPAPVFESAADPVADEVAEEPLRTPEPPIRASARVLTGSTEQADQGRPDLVHLRRIIETGRDQRRYVEDLPRRSDKGTYMRLPVHLQDALAEYCDRNNAPMADFVAALLDSYFRDIGVLPPLGKGHRPNEKVLDKIRKETRTYDY